LIRPVNCLLMVFAVIVGSALAVGGNFVDYIETVLLGSATGFLLCGAAMVINDYYDREIDAINESSRPIPSGAVTPFEAIVLASVLTLLGLANALLSVRVPNWNCFVVALISWLVTMLYVTRGKKMGLIGNLMVSSCMVIPFIYGALLVEANILSTTVIFAAITFLSNTGREITKGIVDVKGDRSNNLRTVAVLFGEKNASVVAALFVFSAISLTPIPTILGLVSYWYIPFVVVTDVGLATASILLVLHPSREKARWAKNRDLFWFFTGLFAFVAGTFS
jgi:4-hydroxybenzoate polyprenyltransferase